ncbi:uncharacterized protein LOC126457754 [Schistocerca serialis cubense]|uniref:uncharacterized protein LOC126457754 n=1 Tax=Schistocerca serialis cubense TaxID=2023355 RepID=UPI00214E5B06|nr:uncharacterized protein LOC126457754 [Schistocerca serialis cubense]
MEDYVEYLWRSADSLPQTGTENTKVRSYLLSLCKEILAKEGLEPPSKFFGGYTICKFCLNHWKSGRFTVRILPRVVPGKRMKKIIRKKLSDTISLNKHELRLFERYEKSNTNKLIITCLECHKKTIISSKKPFTNLYKAKESESAPEYNETQTPSKKKKKKKRDPFAGLKPSVCTPLSTKIKNSPVGISSPARKINSKSSTAGSVSVRQKSTPLSTKTGYKSRIKNTNTLQKLLANSSKKQKVSSLKVFLDSVT